MTDPHNHSSNSNDRPAKKAHTPKRVIFFSACIIIALVVFCIANINSLTGVIGRLGDVLTPIIIGAVIAYLCNPFLKFYEYKLFRRLKHGGLRRGLSLFLTVLTAFGILAVVVALIVPELVDSINKLVANYEFYVNGLLAFVQSVIDKVTSNLDVNIDISDVEKLTVFIEQMFGSMEAVISKVLATLQGFVLDEAFLGNLWGFVTDLVNTMMDILLGIFIAFYILSSKEKRVAQINKFRTACFSEKQNAKIGEVVRLVDRTFGGFIKGVLLDALAVGVVTFILLTIFQVSEYNLLIATICAITNIIPVFGPFIGAIPSALIVLISNPSKLIVFIILVVVIQQIDGNILCPRIQGNNTGVSSLAVLVAITIMGSLFGIMGMVIGVPLFAVFIELVKRYIEKRLQKQGEPTDTTYYYPADAVGNAEEEVYYEHSHLRYWYDHSKCKVYVDRALDGLKRIFKRKNKKAVPPAEDASLPEDGTTSTGTPTDNMPQDGTPKDGTPPNDDAQD